MAPLIEDLCSRGRIELRTPRGIRRDPPLQRRERHLIRRARALHVVEEGIIAKTREHAKPVPCTLEARDPACIAAGTVHVPKPAIRDARLREAAQYLRRHRRLPEIVPAINVKHVAQLVREAVADNIHDEIQVSSIGCSPSVEVPMFAWGLAMTARVSR